MKNTHQINNLLKCLFLYVILFTNILLAESLNFTQEELTYIKQNKTVKIAMLDNFKPFSFVEKDRHQGLSIDIIKRISVLSGLKFDIQISSWSHALQNFKEKKVNMISGISHTTQREKFTLFSEPFYEIPTYIFGLRNDKIYKNNTNLNGKKVGVNKGMFYIDSLKKLGIKVIEYPNSEQKVKALAFGEIDYFLSNYTTGLKAISTQLLTNIKPLDEYTHIKKEDIRYGINKENKILHSIVEKSLSYIDKRDLKSLINKWILQLQEIEPTVSKLNLTKDEMTFLQAHQVIKMCNNQKFEPIEFSYNDNQNDMRGIAIDTLHIIEKQLGLKFENVPTKDWKESQQFLKDKKCDILPAAVKNSERIKYANFTEPYLHFPLAILTHRNKGFVPSLESIIDEQMVKKNGSGLIVKLQDRYQNINIIETKNTQKSFEDISNGKAYYTIEMIPIATDIMAKYIFEDIHIAGYTDMIYNLSIAVRDDNRVLLNILNKSLDTISKKMHDDIYKKWVTIIVKEKVLDYTILIQVSLVLSLIGLFMIYRQSLLKNQNKQLEESSQNFEYLFNNTIESIGLFQDNICININEACVKQFDFKDKSNAIGLNIIDFIAPDSIEIVKKNLLNSNENIYKVNLLRADGTIFPAIVRGQYKLINGKMTRISSMLDISEIKKQEQIINQQSKLASMGEMIGNIAHQWRQPLSVISTGVTGMKLQKEHGCLSDDEFEDTCIIINENAQYLSKTINDFRNFINGDRIKRSFDLTSNINSFLQLVDGSIKSNDIKIILDLEEHIKMNGYENELIQCWINIVNNSKDILTEKMNDDRLIFISTFQKNNNVIIKIKDNAGGILEDVLPKIFEPYFTTKHKTQGTGLGLHMTYNLIVDGMKGTIAAKNVKYEYKDKNYKGAEFIIILPIL